MQLSSKNFNTPSFTVILLQQKFYQSNFHLNFLVSSNEFYSIAKGRPNVLIW